MSSNLIVFSGLDGAGKSTQIDLLKKNLTDRGMKCEVFWSRGGYTSGMEFLKGFLRSSMTKIPAAGHSSQREKNFKKNYVRKMWLVLSILDLLRLYVIVFRVKMIFGKTIIADRYLEDTAIDFSLNFPQEEVENWLLWKFLKKLAPLAKKHFVCIIPVEESLKRSKLKGEPFPDSEETLKIRKERYFSVIKGRDYIIEINGMNNIQEIHSLILKELGFENIITK